MSITLILQLVLQSGPTSILEHRQYKALKPGWWQAAREVNLNPVEDAGTTTWGFCEVNNVDPGQR